MRGMSTFVRSVTRGDFPSVRAFVTCRMKLHWIEYIMLRARPLRIGRENEMQPPLRCVAPRFMMRDQLVDQ